jgi:hypothetical protein
MPTNVCGTGGWTGPLPGDPSNFLAISASPVFGGIQVYWTYPASNPYAVAHSILYRSESGTFSTAVERAIVAGNTFFDQINSSNPVTYYYWLVSVSINGTLGDPIGPATATYQPTVSALIEQLTLRIDEGQLAQALRTKIEQITLNYTELQAEIANRLASNAAYSALMTQMQDDLDGAITVLNTEITNRTEGDSALISQINVIGAANADNAALIAQETTARVNADSAFATQLTTIASMTDSNAAAILSEQTARANGDSANATSITSLNSTVTTNHSTAMTAASNAQTTANTAATNASSALTQLTNIASDSILSPSEKPMVKQDYDTLIAEQSGITTQATNYAITTERTAYTNAVTALTTYLGTLSGWNTIPGSDVTIVGSTFRQKFQDVYTARQALLNAISAAAKSLADGAQGTANSAATAAATAQTTANTAATNASSALTQLTNIASDSILSPSEKPSIKQNYDVIIAEQTGITTQATNYGITTEKTSYTTAVSALTTYLTGLTGWDTIPGSDVVITGSTFRQKFADVYTTRQALLDAIAAKAKTLVASAQSTADTAVTNAATAQTTANTASTNASSALTQLTDISSDDKWTAVEKQQIKIEWDGIVAEKAGINAQATSYAVSTENTAYNTAYALLDQYLNQTALLTNTAGTVSAGSALLSSLTTTTSLDKTYTPAGGSATTLGAGARKVFADFYAARQALLNAIYAKAKSLADTAQSTANSANTAAATAQTAANTAQTTANTASTNATSALSQLTDISSDDRWTALEKQQLKIEWDGIAAEKTGINAQATSYVLSTENTAYNSAYALLDQYLNATAALTNTAGTVSAGSALLSSLTTTTNLDKTYTVSSTPYTLGAGARKVFADFYGARQALLNAIYGKAKTLADNAQSTANSANTAASNAQTTANTASTNASSALTQLTDISADDKWTPVEKQQIKLEWDGIVAEKSGINTQGTNYGLSAENTAYNNGYALVDQYLNNTAALSNTVGAVGAGSNLLSSLSTTTSLDKSYTPAGGSALTFGTGVRKLFADFYATRQALLNAIYAKAKTLADGAQSTANATSSAIVDVKTTKIGYAVLSGTSTPYDGDGSTVVYPVLTYPAGSYPEYVPSRTRIIDQIGVNNWNASPAGASKPLQWLVGLPLASAISTYQVTDANGNIASVQTAFTAQKTLNDDFKAQYTATVDVNGLVGGFGIYNNGASVEAGFNVDLFWVGRTSANKKKPFIISNNTVYIDNALITNLGADRINTTGLIVRDGNGDPIIGAGAPLAEAYLASLSGTNVLIDGQFKGGLTGVKCNDVGGYGLSSGANLNSDYNMRGSGLGYTSSGAYVGWDSVWVNVSFGENVMMPVFPGQKVQAYAYLNTHRSRARVIIVYNDGSGNYLTQTDGNLIDYQTAVYSLDNLQVSSAISTAPANARFAYMVIQGYGKDVVNPVLFFTRCFFGPAGASQTSISTWVDGSGTKFINPSNIDAFIGNLAVNTLQIAGEAVTVPRSTEGGFDSNGFGPYVDVPCESGKAIVMVATYFDGGSDAWRSITLNATDWQSFNAFQVQTGLGSTTTGSGKDANTSYYAIYGYAPITVTYRWIATYTGTVTIRLRAAPGTSYSTLTCISAKR